MNIKLSRKSSIFLTIIGTVGVFTTGYLSAKAAIKSYQENFDWESLSKKEKVKRSAKNFVPAATSGIVTSGCLIASAVLDGKRQTALLSAYSACKQAYKACKDEVKNISGIEKVKSLLSEQVVDVSWKDDEDDKLLFYDDVGERYFWATIRQVQQAEIILNSRLMRLDECTINDFYDILGIDPIEYGDEIGWTTNPPGECLSSVCYIEFELNKVILDGGMECLHIKPLCDPSTGCK